MDKAAQIELQTGDSPDACVIWLHGLGADANDFVPVVPELHLPANMAVRFIFPNAPVIPITINQGYQMPGWYDIKQLDIAGDDSGAHEDQQGIERSSQQMQKLIHQQIELGIAAERIIIAGFSQGGAVALHVGLNYPKRLGGVMALSTYLPFCARTDPARHARLNIFMAHGTQDDVVKTDYGRRSAELLRQYGCELQWHEYPIAHSVNMDEIADIGRWLQQRLA
jgi:phospholipase/carboxylesterase